MNGETTASSPAHNTRPARTPHKGARHLSVVHGKDERSLHLSPILQQIKDDGPALIDGELVREGAAQRLAKPAQPADTKTAAAPAPSAQQPLLGNKQVKVLIGFCAALAIGLCASLYFAWQQQKRLDNMEYMLELLVTSPR